MHQGKKKRQDCDEQRNRVAHDPRALARHGRQDHCADAKAQHNGCFDDVPVNQSNTEAERDPTLWLCQLILKVLLHPLQDQRREPHAEREGEERERRKDPAASPPPVNQGGKEVEQQNNPDIREGELGLA